MGEANNWDTFEAETEYLDNDTVVAQTQDKFFDSSFTMDVERIDVDSLPKRGAYHIIKRLFDVVLCSLALIVLSPIMVIIAIAIKIDSPGPAIFKQERLGKNGKPFMLHKFRSMSITAEADGAHWTSEEDPRITRIGSMIRKSRIDELPQFWDVVRGDMSLVGPRPERAVFYELFEEHIHGFSQRLLVTPGISGLAQVSGGYDLGPEEKIVYDIEYIKNQSVAMDTKIILSTLGVVFSHEGAR